MAETKNLLYTLVINGTDTELDKLTNIRLNIKGLQKDIKEFGDKDTNISESKKLQLKQEQKEYQELQKQITNRNKAEKDSVKTLESMRAELANINKQMERIPVGTKAFEDQQKKAKALRDEINGIDQASGKWQGNVGNYKNAIVDAFQVMGINVSGFTDKLDKVGDLFKTLVSSTDTLTSSVDTLAHVTTTATSATEATTEATTLATEAASVLTTATTTTTAATGSLTIAQRAQAASSALATVASNALSAALRILKIALISTGIGAIVVALGALVAYFTGAQEGADKLTKALLPFKRVLGELVEFAENLGGALVKIFTGDFTQGIKEAGKAFGDLGGNIKQSVKDAAELYDLQIKIRVASLAVLSQEANINNQIAERIKILDNENNSMADRKKAAEEAVQWQEILTKLKKEEAQFALDKFKLDNKNDLDTIENQRTQIELTNKLTELETEGLQSTKKIRNQLYAIQKKQSDDALKAIQDQRTESQKLSEEYLKLSKAFVLDATTFDQFNDAVNGTGKLIDDLSKEIQSIQTELSKSEVGTPEWLKLNKQLTVANEKLDAFKASLQTLEVRDIEFNIPDGSEIFDSEATLFEQMKNLAIDANEEIVASYKERFEAIQALFESGQITEEQAKAATVVVRREQNEEIVNDASFAFDQLGSVSKQYSDSRAAQNEKDFQNGKITEKKYLEEKKSIATQSARIEATQAAFRQVVGISETLTALGVGAAQTAKVGFPQNIPLLIGFAAQVAGLLASIKNIVIPAVPKFARGVIGLDGAGTSTSDSIDAKLSRGESVVTAKATKVYAPVLAEMERSVGNRPNVQIGSRHYASGFIPTPVSGLSVDVGAQIRQAVRSVASIPVVVAEGEINTVRNRVRRIKVAGDL